MSNETETHTNGASTDLAAIAAVANGAVSTETPESTEPKPLSFDDLALHPDIKKALDDMGYFAPTAVQHAVFGPVSEGKDLLVQSRTGTGKTTAFGLPTLSKIVPTQRTPQALILAPTRELALQVARELTKIGQHRGIVVEAIYGGAPIGKQITNLKNGVHVVVGTPGRVLDHIGRRTLDTKTISTFILDECDEMLSMGFLDDILRVVKEIPEKKQTLLFSATMPDEVARYSRQHMTNPVQMSLSRDGQTVADIHHAYYIVSGIARSRDLLKVIFAEEPESAIIFCNMRDETTQVAKFLMKQGLDAEALSSDLSQADRERVMGRMKAKNLRFLCATDVAARGIDISNLTHVINFSVPESPESYVHRTGRTGRAGKKGTAISLVGPRELGNFRFVRLTFGLKPEERVLPKDDIFIGKLKVPLPPVGVPTPPDPVQILIRGIQNVANDLETKIFEKMLTSQAGKKALAALVADKLDKLSTRTKPKRERTERPEGEGAPEGERSFDRADRPDGDRPRRFDGERGDRPRRFDGDRPDGDRPRRFDRDRPDGDRPRGDRPDGDRPRRFDGDRPEGDRPRGDRPEGDRPRGDRPDGDRPRRFDGERGDRPRRFDGERGDRPRGDRPDGDRPRRFDGERNDRPENTERTDRPAEASATGERPTEARADRPERGEGRGDRERRPWGDRGEGRRDRHDRPERRDEAVTAEASTDAAAAAPASGEAEARPERSDRPEGRDRDRDRGGRDRDRGSRFEGRDRGGRDRGDRGDRGADLARHDRNNERHGESARPAGVDPDIQVTTAMPVIKEEPKLEDVAARATERADKSDKRDDKKAKGKKSEAPGETREFWETWADDKASRPAPEHAAPATVAEAAPADEAEKPARGRDRDRGRGGRDKERGGRGRGKAEAAPAEAAAPVEEKAEKSDKAERGSRSKRDTTVTPPPVASAAATGEQARLFVSLGKKHGVTSDDLRKLLSAPIGGDASQIGSISLRDSHAHVRVPESHVDAIIGAVNGTSHNEHDVTVERARA
ncbi:MAG TPA: DEAD/DEAH box helicase [Kofleriaceae bacterium]|jgi:ATP-dependent RNA helicase DeaD